MTINEADIERVARALSDQYRAKWKHQPLNEEDWKAAWKAHRPNGEIAEKAIRAYLNVGAITQPAPLSSFSESLQSAG